MSRLKQLLRRPYFRSYAQHGEDVIVTRLMGRIGARRPFYIDIGASDPVSLSNTFALYQSGGSGICVEANPAICARFHRRRPRDVVLNNVVTMGGSGRLPFYLMNSDVMSTADAAEAEFLVKEHGYHIDRVADIEAISPDQILARAPAQIDFLSIDIEEPGGSVVAAFTDSNKRPAIICAEIVSFSQGIGEATRYDDLIEQITAAGYLLYASTYINGIFLDRERFQIRAER